MLNCRHRRFSELFENDLTEKIRAILLVITEGVRSGIFPYTNAYDNTASALLNQSGIAPKRTDNIILVFKSFISRV